MSSNEFAPLILFVYNRPDHTRRVLQALRDNNLAEKTDFYIFSDAAANENARLKVEEVRNFILKVCDEGGFHSVHLKLAEKNLGCRSSVISGVTEVLKKHGKAIIVEDDIMCRKNFLNYMNDALNLFESDSRIWSIGAHTRPFPELNDYPYDIFLTYRACSWGWGIWKDRWDKIDWKVSDYESFRRNPIQRFLFARGGTDLFAMMENEMKGQSSAWDMRLQYAMAKDGSFTVYPKTSFTYNVGFDGSGTHCVDTGNESYESLDAVPYTLISDIRFNRKINRGFLHTEYPSFSERVMRKIQHLTKQESLHS